MHEATTAEFDDILVPSARNNGTHDVTGMLLFAAGSFMHILEGEERAVEENYDRISRDPRRNNVFALERGLIAEPSRPLTLAPEPAWRSNC